MPLPFLRPRPLSSALGLSLLFCISPLVQRTVATGDAADTLPASATVRLADGFDFPVGWPEAVGYHKARGFTPNGHLGEDWDGDGGGNTDLGDPIYCVGNGVVVLARDMRLGWGNVVIIRHSFKEPADGNAIHTVDTLYGHLDTIGVNEGQQVARGQQIATMGTAHGMYEAHLHFEVRKNLNIGMYRSAFARDFSNYYDPTQFIKAHRKLERGGTAIIALNTFVPYPHGPGLPPSDGAYEMGINRSPASLAAMASSHLSKSAYSIKPHESFEKINGVIRYDPYSDVHSKGDN